MGGGSSPCCRPRLPFLFVVFALSLNFLPPPIPFRRCLGDSGALLRAQISAPSNIVTLSTARAIGHSPFADAAGRTSSTSSLIRARYGSLNPDLVSYLFHILDDPLDLVNPFEKEVFCVLHCCKFWYCYGQAGITLLVKDWCIILPLPLSDVKLQAKICFERSTLHLNFAGFRRDCWLAVEKVSRHILEEPCLTLSLLTTARNGLIGTPKLLVADLHNFRILAAAVKGRNSRLGFTLKFQTGLWSYSLQMGFVPEEAFNGFSLTWTTIPNRSYLISIALSCSLIVGLSPYISVDPNFKM